MLNDPFLKQLNGIDWDSLAAREAVELRAALLAAIAKSDEWFAGLNKGFQAVLNEQPAKPERAEMGETPALSERAVASELPVVSERPPKRGRGRPRKQPAPLAVGGADAPAASPRPATIFQNSYVGPRPDPSVPFTIPADHPRFQGPHDRPTSVTPEGDAADFTAVEQMGENGVRSYFNPKG